MKNAERLAQERGAILALPLNPDVVTSEEFIKLIGEFLPYASKEIFRLANPELAQLDATRARLMDREKLTEIAHMLATVVPKMASERLLTLSLYNLRMTNIARRISDANEPLPPSAKIYIEQEIEEQHVTYVKATTFGEVKMLAEQYRTVMQNAKKIDGKNPVRLKVEIDPTKLSSQEQKMVSENTTPELLKIMNVDDILQADDLLFRQRDIREIRESLREEYGERITIVDRYNEDRNESDIPSGIVFAEYKDKYVTSYHYNAVLEALMKPERPVLSDRRKGNKFWFIIRPITAIDFEQLKHELERYAQVLMAA